MLFYKPKNLHLDQLYIMNNIFYRHKFIFIHVPKCAGSSLSLNLLGYQIGHTPYKIYENLLGVDLRNYFTFAIVRNPVARFLSAYRYIKKGGINSEDKIWQSQLGSPNDVLLGLNQGRGYSIHFKKQVHFLQSRQEYLTLNYVHKIEDNIDKFIPILRFYTDEFIANRIESALSAELKKNMVENSKSDDSNLDLNLLFKIYEDDFWRLGYDQPNT